MAFCTYLRDKGAYFTPKNTTSMNHLIIDLKNNTDPIYELERT